jgi:hypothetical protein
MCLLYCREFGVEHFSNFGIQLVDFETVGMAQAAIVHLCGWPVWPVELLKPVKKGILSNFTSFNRQTGERATGSTFIYFQVDTN